MNWIERRRRLSRRRRLLRLSLGLLLVIGVVVLAGLVLPGVRVTSGSVILDAPPETVWLVLTDFDGMPRWRSDLRGLERLPDQGGRPAWREFGSGRGGTRVIQLVTAEPHHRLVTRRIDRGGDPHAVRTIELARREGREGTVVTVTEQESVDPVARVLSGLRINRNSLRFLNDLARVLGGHPRQVVLAPE